MVPPEIKRDLTRISNQKAESDDLKDFYDLVVRNNEVDGLHTAVETVTNGIAQWLDWASSEYS